MTPDLPPDPPAPDPDAREVLEILNSHLVNSPLGVVEWDHEFRVRSWSGRAEELFGWTADEVLGKHPDDWRFVHEEDTASVTTVIEGLLEGGTPRNISANRNYTKDGSIVFCEWYNSVLTDTEGRLVSVLSLIHDVTRRKTTEEQVRQLQKMESIGQLTGGIAHDFNNLLTVILGLGDLLAEELDSRPDLRGLVLEMMGAANRGATLTHDLLSFARQQPLDPRATDIDALLGRLSGLLRRSLGEHVELEVIPHADGQLAEVDPSQLESAILNLCINARDAMEGGGRLTVETEVVRIEGEECTSPEESDTDIAPGDYVVIATSDTGVGIAPEHRPKVFDPFFTTKRTGSGTGLGLSMVFGFAKQSGGGVRIYSEVDRGTTVRLYLPVAADSRPHVRVPTPVLVPTGSERVLVVEDDDMVRSYAELQLRALGYDCIAVDRGRAALEVLESDDSVDLLFTDIVMPGGMDGLELARCARTIRSRLSVLFTSGYTENAAVRQGRLDSGILLLSKPYQRGSLARKVREALDTGPGTDRGRVG